MRLHKDLYMHKSMRVIDLVLAGTGEAGIFIDREGTIRAWNRAAENLTGYTMDEVIGSDISILMETHHAKFHQHYLDAYFSGREQDTTTRVVGKTRRVNVKCKDGEVKECFLRVTHIDNGVQGFVGSLYIAKDEQTP